MNINGKKLGAGRCYIIAEAGVNHNGDINVAKQLVDAAQQAGADAVKFQTFKTELLVTDQAEKAEYQKNETGEASQFDMLKKLELSENEFNELRKYCAKKGIAFLSTPHSGNWSVDVLEKLSIAAYKVGSGDLTNIPLLKYIARKGKPVIISTGMAVMNEIREAKKAIEAEGNKDVVVLQCTTMYPCPPNKANLAAMKTIARETNTLAGYSDHTTTLEAPVLAACLGATVIEKHMTMSRKMQGPDHKASFVPEEMERLVRAVRLVNEKGLTEPGAAFKAVNEELGYELDGSLIGELEGNGEKRPEPEELEIAKVARKSIVAVKDIKEGRVLCEENIGVRRPGEGMAPNRWEEVIGKVASKDIGKNEYITEGMLR